MTRLTRLTLLFSLMLSASGARAGLISVSSSKIKIVAEDQKDYMYIETPSGADLLYSSATLGTTHAVYNYDGNKFDMQSAATQVSAVAGVGSGLGAYIQFVKQVGNLQFGQRFTIVVNPRTGLLPDTVQCRLWIKNLSSTQTSQVGARLELDTQIIDTSHDNALLSVDNGVTTVDRNTLYTASSTGVPIDWWAYDAIPATLAATGVTGGHVYGEDPTPPDAMEMVHWNEVQGTGYWDPHPSIGTLLSSYSEKDTCTVIWWTGTGDVGRSNVNPSISLPPGAVDEFVTYYGLNQSVLQKSPTPFYSPTPSLTISPTHSISPTFSESPTKSPSFSITPTFSITQTKTVSTTKSPSFTQSPTFTLSPTRTVSPTLSPSFTETETRTHSATLTVSATPSPTPTVSESFTVSPTLTISATCTVSMTVSPTRTVTPTATPPPPDLRLIPRPPNPNPAGPDGVWLPYIVTRDCTVRIRLYTIAGETVRDLKPFAAKQGANEEFWDERNDAGAVCASGVFIYRIQAVADTTLAEAWMKLSVAK